ncbi:MAG TPA: ATP-binding protein [Planctomycetota bacterium]|nr:ATP-binding protein [Planctomycetota bacterium]
MLAATGLGGGAALLVLDSWSGAALLAAVFCVLQIAVLSRAERCRDRAVTTAMRASTKEVHRGDAARLLAMELSLDRVRSVLESLREGVVVVDAQGEVVMANPAANRALADAQQPSVGRPLWGVLGGEFGPRAQQAWSALRAQAADSDQQIRVPAIPCNGRVFDLTAVPVKSRRSGQDFGSVFLVVDVTRNHELAHLKDQFLSSISHELRTPLTNICAYAEILRHLTPSEMTEWPEFVRIIHEEGLHLSRLVDSVFDYLQLESGEARFSLEVVAVPEVVRAAVAATQGRASAAGIAIELQVLATPPPVLADRRRLQQVATQLLDNGLKFTPAGGRVRVVVSDRDGCCLLRVDDSGRGVPSDHRLAVFEKFCQLSNHLTEKPSGAGLGLASCRAIVARLGGMIWCEDSPLGGAGFVVLLPPNGQQRVVPVETALAGMA